MESHPGSLESFIGRVIANYRLDKLLGTGVSGAVFLSTFVGEEPPLLAVPGEAPVAAPVQAAVKLLIMPVQMSIVEQAEFRARFLREAQTLTTLHHPHILSILTFGDDRSQNLTYMVLPYLPGGTLAGRLRAKGGRLELNDAATYIAQIGEALDYAHQRDIVHRDVKPANVLLDVQDQAYLADFGIVHVLQSLSAHLTTTGKILGTPAYMSPEQVTGSRDVGPAADIYSLGMVAYEMVAGHVAFTSSNIMELIRQQATAQPPSLRSLRPELPEPAEAAIMRALSKEPVRRFMSASDLARAFALGIEGKWFVETGPTPENVATQSPAHPSTLYAALPGRQRSSLPSDPMANTIGPVTPYPISQTIHRSGSFGRRALLAGLVGAGVVIATLGVVDKTHGDLLFNSGSSGTTTPGSGSSTSSSSPPVSPQGSTFAVLRGHEDYVDFVIWSPDGKHLASCSWDLTARIWDTTTYQQKTTYTGHSDHVIAAAWSPDGAHVATASDDGTVQIWDPFSGTNLLTYTGHTDGVWSVSWSLDGSRIASAGKDMTVRVWNPANGNTLKSWKAHSNYIHSSIWSPDGSRIVTASYDHTAIVWDVATESPIVVYSGHTGSVWMACWSPDGLDVATSGDTTVHIWDARTGATSVVYSGHSSSTWTVAWSPIKQYIASGGYDTTVQVWNPYSGGQGYIYRGHHTSVNSVGWSPNGERIASGADDRTIRIWEGK